MNPRQHDVPNQEIILRPSLKKVWWVLLVSILFTIILTFSLVDDTSTQEKIIDGFGILFFGGIGVFFLYKLVSREPTMIINSKGVYPSFLRKSIERFIPWEDIKKVSHAKQIIRSAGTNEFLVIHLKNPEAYNFNDLIDKEHGLEIAKKLSHITNIKGDLYIPSIMLPHSVKKTLEIFKKYPVTVKE